MCVNQRQGSAGSTVPAGNLCLIPQRIAIALQEDKWLVRSVVCWCLSPSTVLYAKTATTEGPMTIHDLVRLDPSTVKLWTGVKWSQVRGWSANETAGDTRRIILRSGEAITCTANHKWPLADGLVVKADELNIGDVLATTTLPQPERPDGLALDELAWFAGLYLAEGNLNDDCINISGHTREVERHLKVEAIVKKYGGSTTLHCEGDTALQRIHGRVLLGAIEHFIAGHGAKGKHFHPRAWLSSNGVLHSLLRGYLDGDGHWDETNGRWRLGFCRNNALAQDLRTVAARLGLTLTINPTYSKMGRSKTFESYRGEIRHKAPEGGGTKSRAEVVKIERGWGGTFYDIGIEDEPHLFALASGVLTHNSKPAPMPAPLSGWAWRRCRVNLGGHQSRGAVQRNVPGAHASPSTPTNSSWSDCPGCLKCEKHGGFVLRKGSWRPTSSWEPILMLAKTPDYFCDGESVKQPSAAATISRNEYSRILDDPDEQFAVKHDHETTADGANLRDVWTIASQPLSGVAIPKRQLVSSDEADGGTARIPSGDCPVHGPRSVEQKKNTASCGEREAFPSLRKSCSDDRLASAPPVGDDTMPHDCGNSQGETGGPERSPNDMESSKTSDASGEDKPQIPCSSVGSEASPSLAASTPPHATSAKPRSKRSRKKAPAPETVPQDTSCEGNPSRTERSEGQPLFAGMQQSTPDRRSESPDSAGCPSPQTPDGTARTESLPDEPLSAPEKEKCTCQYYRWKNEEVNHYAAFPSELVLRCIRAGTSLQGYCPTCGKPWCRVIETPTIPAEMRNRDAKMSYHPMGVGGGQKIQEWRDENPSKTLDWRPSCSCPLAPPRPGLVLDPFAGSGRTLLTARRLGLDAVGVELNPEYADMASRLLTEDSPLFNQVQT